MSEHRIFRALRRLAVLPIEIYQRWISPWTPATCRFQPTCSAYVREAVLSHGLLRGGWLGIRRVARCHPFSEPGCDPVPSPPGDIDENGDEDRQQPR